MAKRPAGVTLIAVLVWINGILNVIGGIIALLPGGGNFGAGIVAIIIGVVTIAVGVGLLRGSQVARVIATIVLILSLASAVYLIVVGIATPASIVTPIISGILALVALIMLYTKRASAFFPRVIDDPPHLTVLSYNLWEGRAQRELGGLVEAHDPDVLCLQEARGPGLPQRLGPLELAIVTPRNRLGVALYVKSERLEMVSARSFQLTVSRHDRLVGGTEHRLAAARVRDRRAGRDIVLGSFHATPFTDSNAARRRQVDDAHAALEELGPGLPSVMAGDYNHPILLFMLGRHLRRRGLTLALPTMSTFHREGSIMRGKFDVATVSQFVVIDTVTLAQAGSDHRAVLFTMAYSA